MQAVVVEEYGPLDGPVVKEVPTPAMAADQVLIEIHAAPVNYVDTVVISGKYQFLPELPFTPGKGPAGVVIAKGSAVSALSLGDRVLAMVEQGGYAQQVVADPEQCYRLPDSMSFTEAASMSLGYDTAWFALRARARINKGDTVLVLGASGAVGMAAMQLAKAMGASRVMAGVSRPEAAGHLKELGADALINLAAPNLRDDLRAQVYAVNDGVGADVILDMVGGDAFDAAIRALAWSGRMVVVGFAAGRIPTIKANYLLVKNIEVSGLQISDYRKRQPELVAECFKEIFSFYEQGLVQAAPAKELALKDYAQGLDMLIKRTTGGHRIVLTPAQ